MAPAEALANAATSKDLPGGVKLRCIGCSNCQVTVLAEDGQGNKNYGCAGNCPTHGCDAMVQVPAGSVVESIF